MLKVKIPKYYIVKEGQTLKDISRVFGVAVGVLIRDNRLTEEVFAGQALYISEVRGNVYVAQAGDTKSLICGSEQQYFQRNGTHILYPEMQVIL